MSKKIMLAISQMTGGGAERVVSIFANQLVKNGYDVAVLLFNRAKYEYELSPSVKIFTASDTRDNYLKLSFSQRFSAFRGAIKGFSPDYLISFLPSMQVWIYIASFGLRIKRIETVRISPWEVNLGSKLYNILWRQCMKSAYRIVLQATEQKEFFTKAEQKKCVLVPNPILPYYENNYKEELSEKVTEFVAAGRLTEQKNYPMMIKAFSIVAKRHGNINLRIFGTGDLAYIEKLESLIKENGMEGRITLMGRTPHMELEYKKSDVFLMTSDFEGLPNALIEAMATRLICVSTDCKTGPQDLIENGKNGFLIPTENEERLVAVIEEILNMSYEKVEEMVNKARELILSHCTENNSTAKLIRILEEK